MNARTDEERSRAHNVITSQIDKVCRLVKDLLSGSRPTEDKIELHKQTVPLRTILTAAESLVRSTCHANRQTLTIKLPPEPIYLEADAPRLEQVFGSLLGDACKRTGEGGHITVTAEREPGAEIPRAVVRVRDDGAGIDAASLPKIFAPRSHAGLSGNDPHSGLPLAQRVVEMHGGSIQAVSEGPGCGAEFIVRLPNLEIVSPGTSPFPGFDSPPPVVTRRRMLIVDDNVDSTQSMATLQKRRGHDVRTAATGLEALAIAVDFLPEVVLLDIGLPGIDGFEVARRLRAMPAMSSAFLIAMTGYASDDDRRRAREVGFDEHLIKPVDLEVVRKWLADDARFRG